MAGFALIRLRPCAAVYQNHTLSVVAMFISKDAEAFLPRAVLHCYIVAKSRKAAASRTDEEELPGSQWRKLCSTLGRSQLEDFSLDPTGRGMHVQQHGNDVSSRAAVERLFQRASLLRSTPCC